MTEFLESHKLLSESRYGFSSGKSTKGALLETCTYKFASMYKRKCYEILFI